MSAACFPFSLSPEDGDGIFLPNVCSYLQVHTVLNPEDQHRHLHRRENLKSEYCTGMHST
jgi:hypothetical protein